MKTAVEILIEQLEGTLVQAVYERLENSGIFTEALQLEGYQKREAYKDGLINKLEYEDQHDYYFIEKYFLNND
jgi:hypothetical protein